MLTAEFTVGGKYAVGAISSVDATFLVLVELEGHWLDAKSSDSEFFPSRLYLRC